MESQFGDKLTKRIPNSIAPKRIPHLGESRPTAWGVKNMVIGLKRHGTGRADTISTLTGAVARQPAQPLTGAIKGEAVKLLLILSRATHGVEGESLLHRYRFGPLKDIWLVFFNCLQG